jgi:aminoglycoside phosphotransferase (APT) family kinase protein
MSPAYEKPDLPLPKIASWLAEHFSGPVRGLAPIEGGFWSAGYVFEASSEAYVLRLGRDGEGYRIDREAHALAGPQLPIPEVVSLGEVFDLHYAISRRHRGRFIERAPASEGRAIGDAMAGLLAALRAVPAPTDAQVLWYETGPLARQSWRERVLAGIVDEPGGQVSGWREKLAQDAALDRLFGACEARIGELLPRCPERRDLVHSDLLHQNVLVDAEDPSRVTAVFSWKCSMRGDFLYDVAWCTFWSPWHPAIAEAELWRRTLEAPDLEPADLADAALRHHCYELQIAASHLGWQVWVDNAEDLAAVARATEALLARGPLAS